MTTEFSQNSRMRLYQGTKTSISMTAANMIGWNCYGYGDGVSKVFALANDRLDSGLVSYSDIGRIAESEGVHGIQYWVRGSRFYSKSGDTLSQAGANAARIDSVPPISSQLLVVFPPLNPAVFKIQQAPDYLHSDYCLFAVGCGWHGGELAREYYVAAPDESKIQLYFTSAMNQLNFGPHDVQPSWYQFAPVNPNMSIGSYKSAGAPLELTDFFGGSLSSQSYSPGQTVINVLDASSFTAGSLIAYSEPAEINWLSAVDGNNLHLANSTASTIPSMGVIYECGRAFSVKLTRPGDADPDATGSRFHTTLCSKYSIKNIRFQGTFGRGGVI